MLQQLVQREGIFVHFIAKSAGGRRRLGLFTREDCFLEERAAIIIVII